MRLVLVGADFEENLGMCMIAAAAESFGHRTHVVAFQSSEQRAHVVDRVLDLRPDVVGLAAQFQHRGIDFLGLAGDLRRSGFKGHITAGGQFATMAHASILSGRYGVDSVVLYEGERTIGELLDAVGSGRPLAEVAGLALPDGKGGAFRTAPRSLIVNLDALPLAQRYRQHSRQYGIPFIPMSGSRGCWSACSFCSITSVLRDGREHGVDGHRLRLRSPQDVGLEMAMLAQAVGGSAIFCFHDENFLLPRPGDSLARISAMKRVLDEQGVSRLAFVGKCRPDTVTRDLARELARLGVMRMYVGVENASTHGVAHLNRRTDVATMGAALDAFSDAGIFACYNLLIFEPETILDDVSKNIAFMRMHASTPVNFCRAEPYLGTPMYHQLQSAGRLTGSFLGCDYRIADDRAELLFRIAAAVFRQRNFGKEGVANRYMSLGYSAKLLDVFYTNNDGERASLMERAQEITRNITHDSAEWLELALDIAATVDLSDHDSIARKTAQLGLRIAAADRIWHAAIDALDRDMAKFANGEAARVRKPVSRTAKVAQGAAMAGWLVLWATGGTSCGGRTVNDPLPRDAGGLDVKKDTKLDDGPLVMDPLPRDSGARNDVTVYDPPPADSGARKDVTVYDPLPPDSGARDVAGYEGDSVPPDSGAQDIRADVRNPIDTSPIDGDYRDMGKERPMVIDCLPYDIGPLPVVDPLPPDNGVSQSDAKKGEISLLKEGYLLPQEHPNKQAWATREHWTDASPQRMKRSTDLPLCLCPELCLTGEWQADHVRVRLAGVSGPFSIRWQSQGEVVADGDEVLWTPSSDEDQLDVAVRTSDGVAITALRMEQVRGKRTA